MASSKLLVLNDREHVYMRPTVFIGSIETHHDNKHWVFDEANGKMVFQTVSHNEGYIKCIDEIVTNSFDNIPNGMTKMDVSFNDVTGFWTVSNNGETIPIKKNETMSDLYNPQVAFGQLRCSSNFVERRDNKFKLGQNGYGCKLTNVFSTDFLVTCTDNNLLLKYEQSWKDNMLSMTAPKIKTLKKATNGYTTIISFRLDGSVFKMTDDEIKDQVKLIHTDLIRRSALFTDVKVSFNGKKLLTKSFNNFMRCFPVSKPVIMTVDERLDIGFGLAEEHGHQSFVNNHYTSNGGTHLTFALNKICFALQQHFNKKSGQTRMTAAMIRSKLFVFVNMHVEHARFTSQTKTTLSTAVSTHELKVDKILSLAKRCGLTKALEDELLSKENKQLGRAISGSKKKSISVHKLVDAEKAGTSESYKCSLILTEGDSAKTMAITGFTEIGTEKYGVFPLKGKIMNTVSAKVQSILKNEEISNICKIVGLSTSNRYEHESDLLSLRYRYVICLTDADVDGYHIFSLFAAFITTFFPNLLKHGFLQRMCTPVIKVSNKKRNQELEFFDIPSFNRWEKQQEQPIVNTHTVRYLKGLGTSTRAEAIQYFKHLDKYLRPVTVVDDLVELKKIIKLLFDAKSADERKKWLQTGEIRSIDYTTKTQSLEEILMKENKQYHLESLTRSIPSVVDGKKECQRKVIHASLTLFNTNGNAEKKVYQFGAYVAGMSGYLHGEKSITDTIVKMAQSFPGSNNCALLREGGQFGSRQQNGADAASSRYIFTNLRPITTMIFHPSDKDILSYRCEEGRNIEPEFFVPIIPLILANGSNGIATGYRSLIPQFNPIDIIQKLLQKLQGLNEMKLLPFYNGWKGTVSELSDKWILTGCYRLVGTNKVHITEIPIAVSIEKYTTFLQGLVNDKKINSFIQKHPDENSVHFVISLASGTPSDLVKFLNLSSSIPKSCLNLLDRHGNIKHYNSIDEIFCEYFDIRMEYYEKRQQHICSTLQQKLQRQYELKKFVIAAKNIVFQNYEHEALITKIVQEIGVTNERATELLDIKVSRLSKTNVITIENTILKLKKQYEYMKNSTPTTLYIDDLNKLKSHFVSKNKRKNSIVDSISKKIKN